MKSKEFGRPGGGVRPSRPPLDPPMLFHWGKVDSRKCDWRDEPVQSIMHIMFHCEVRQELWIFVKECTSGSVSINVQNIILNAVHEKPKHVVNFIVLLTKFMNFQQKCLHQTPTVALLKKEIWFYQNLGTLFCTTDNSKKKALKRWEPVLLKTFS